MCSLVLMCVLVNVFIIDRLLLQPLFQYTFLVFVFRQDLSTYGMDVL